MNYSYTGSERFHQFYDRRKTPARLPGKDFTVRSVENRAVGLRREKVVVCRKAVARTALLKREILRFEYNNLPGRAYAALPAINR